MGAHAANLHHLLDSGQIRRGKRTSRHPPPAWGWAELAGRFVELVGSGPTALLTTAVSLVLDAQQHREPVAWITRSRATFFPPDVADNGVDLGALAVVRLDEPLAMLRAADHLLRSGAFGLTVLDLAPYADVPLAAQTRLASLAKKHDAAVVCLSPGGAPLSLGSLVSLRAESRRRRAGDGRFEGILHVVKDKRHGPGREHVQVFRGPVGMR